MTQLCLVALIWGLIPQQCGQLLFRQWKFLTAPFLFPSYEKVDHAIDGGLGDKLAGGRIEEEGCASCDLG